MIGLIIDAGLASRALRCGSGMGGGNCLGARQEERLRCFEGAHDVADRSTGGSGCANLGFFGEDENLLASVTSWIKE